MALLVRSEILGVFVNKLTVNDMYSRHKRENVTHVVQMEIIKNQKLFAMFFFFDF